MPIFYQHFNTGHERLEDLEGAVYPDDQAAIADAQTAGRELLAEKVRLDEVIHGQQIEIEDENGRPVAVVRFRDLLRLPD